MTQFRWGLMALLTAGATLCAPAARGDGAVVPPGPPPALAADEGFVFIGFDLPTTLGKLKFEGEGRWVAKLDIGDVPAGETAVLLRLPVGEYCIASYRIGALRFGGDDRGEFGQCFKSIAGTVNYAGTMEAEGDVRRMSTRIWFKPERFIVVAQARYPGLLDGRTRLIGTYRSGGDWKAQSIYDFVFAAYDAGEPTLADRWLAPYLDDLPADVLVELGRRHLEGEGLPRDRDLAYARLEAAVAKGSTRARELMCVAPIDPNWVDYDDADALTLAAKRAVPHCEAAAEAGSIAAMRVLSTMAKLGVGLAQDEAVTLRWQRQLAENGDADAMVAVAEALRAGRHLGQDAVAARTMYERAVAASSSAAARTGLAGMLARGEGGPSDLARALAYWREAAAQEHAPALVELAQRHYRGDGVAEDPILARQLFERAAARDPDGKVAYAWFLATCAEDVQRDGRRAREFVRAVLRRRDATPEDRIVLAAAMAEAGDFFGAAREAQAAIDRVAKVTPADTRLATWRAQLAGYKKDRPWREPAR